MPRRFLVRYPGAFLVVGAVLMLLSNGRWIFPLFAWLYTAGYLIYLDRARRFSGLIIALCVYVIVTMIQWQGLIPAPGAIYYLIAFVYALAYFLPFIIHGLLAERVGGWTSALIFPTTFVSVEFLFHRWVTPYGSWFSLAYTQPDHVAFLQVGSLVGIAGVSFLMTWFASLLARATQPVELRGDLWKPASVFGAVMVAVLIFGQIRILPALPLPDGRIRTASMVPNTDLMGAMEDALTPVRRGETMSDEMFDELAQSADRLNVDLIRRSRREAEAGARLIAWAETAGRVLKEDEASFVTSLQELAAAERVVLMVGYGVFDPEASPPLENKVAAIDNSGRLAWEYQKAHPIVGAESGFIRSGDGVIRSLDTAFGRIGAVICHDLDFPELLLQASRMDLDLIVGPSADWADITPLHANMARLRAIEGGFSLLRPTSGGRTIATDPYGRQTAVVDYPRDAVIAQVTPRRVSTLYGLIGDSFSWLCVLGLLGFIATALRRKPASMEFREGIE